jgi:hypothetical protein
MMEREARSSNQARPTWLSFFLALFFFPGGRLELLLNLTSSCLSLAVQSYGY